MANVHFLYTVYCKFSLMVWTYTDSLCHHLNMTFSFIWWTRCCFRINYFPTKKSKIRVKLLIISSDSSKIKQRLHYPPDILIWSSYTSSCHLDIHVRWTTCSIHLPPSAPYATLAPRGFTSTCSRSRAMNLTQLPEVRCGAVWAQQRLQHISSSFTLQWKPSHEENNQRLRIEIVFLWEPVTVCSPCLPVAVKNPWYNTNNSLEKIKPDIVVAKLLVAGWKR